MRRRRRRDARLLRGRSYLRCGVRLRVVAIAATAASAAIVIAATVIVASLLRRRRGDAR